MSDRTPLTITVQILNRAGMTTGTLPNSIGPWTYHHILPVRVYYLTAATILRVVTNEFCWNDTRRLGIIALGQMCNNAANRNALGIFVNASVGAVLSAADIQGYANRCSNPPFGGFAGPNPTQRHDDPHDSEEPNRPYSMETAWWDSVKSVCELVYGAFGLVAMPLPQQICTATKPVYEWCTLVEGLRRYIDFAYTAGSASFDPTDWVLHPPNSAWVMRTGRNYAVPTERPPMRLRLRGERKDCLDFNSLGGDDATRLAQVQRRGIRRLVRDLNDEQTDYLNAEA